MAPSLPVELLDTILALAAPLDYSPSSHSLRQLTLRSCCLASKTLRAIAQPRLPEVFVADSAHSVKLLLPKELGGRGFGVATKVLVVEDHLPKEHPPVTLDDLEEESAWLALPAVCAHVVDLRVCMSTVNLNFICLFRRVQRLTLASTTAISAGQYLFPALRVLSLAHVQIDEDLLDDLAGQGGAEEPFPTLPDDALERLSAVATIIEADDDVPDLPDPGPLLLVDTESFVAIHADQRFKDALPPHLRIIFPDNHSFQKSSPFFSKTRLASAYDDIEALIALLYDTPRAAHAPHLQVLRDELLELGAREGLEVFWYRPMSVLAGWSMSEGFITYATKQVSRSAST
ncbi:hypothetical protein JCM10213_002638 [Rhodosporidiobolus nylandii]